MHTFVSWASSYNIKQTVKVGEGVLLSSYPGSKVSWCTLGTNNREMSLPLDDFTYIQLCTQSVLYMVSSTLPKTICRLYSPLPPTFPMRK